GRVVARRRPPPVLARPRQRAPPPDRRAPRPPRPLARTTTRLPSIRFASSGVSAPDRRADQRRSTPPARPPASPAAGFEADAEQRRRDQRGQIARRRVAGALIRGVARNRRELEQGSPRTGQRLVQLLGDIETQALLGAWVEVDRRHELRE